MSDYRIALIDWTTAFGDVVRSPSVQISVGWFWWVTLTHCETKAQAQIYIQNRSKRPPDKLIRVMK